MGAGPALMCGLRYASVIRRFSAPTVESPELIRSKVVFEKNFTPVLRPGSLEIGFVMSGLNGRVNTHFPDYAKWIAAFERSSRRVVKRTAGIGNQNDVPRRIGPGCDGVIDVGGVVEISIGAYRHHQFCVEPRRPHRHHQGIVDKPLPGVIELNDARQRGAPSGKPDVFDDQTHLAQPVVEHSLMTESRQSLMVGIGASLMVAINRT